MTAVFSEENGWPFGEIDDTDSPYEKEKQLDPGHPVRDVSAFDLKVLFKVLFLLINRQIYL